MLKLGGVPPSSQHSMFNYKRVSNIQGDALVPFLAEM